MCVARVLSDFVNTVTIIERDGYPSPHEFRPGVPQARHVHNLLARGLREFEGFFPGFDRQMRDCGAVAVETGWDIATLWQNGWGQRSHTGLWQLMGYPESAHLRNNETMRLVREEKDRSHLLPILFWSTALHLLLREPAAAYRSMEESLRVQSEENLAAIVPISEFFLGRTLVQLGEVDRGLDQMVRYPRETARFAQGPVGALIYPTLAEAYLAARRIDEGIQAVSHGIAILEQNQARFAEPELHRLNGELMLLAENESNEPENSFRRAIEIARGQGAKWYELRATNVLARLLMQQNRRNEARAMLAVIYGWFTEGLDTVDLKEAKALLDDLSV